MRPILASVLVLALMRGVAFAEDGDSYYSPYNYAGKVAFSVTNYTGETLTDFPVYVKISEELIPGFKYSDLKNGTDDLVFFDSLGKVLACEGVPEKIDGAFGVWLKMSAFRNGETVTMCWNLRDGCSKPEQKDPATIWSDYVGVWHMDEEISAEEASVPAHSEDATGHGYDIVPKKGSKGDFARTVSTAGVFGNARVNDTNAPGGKGGNGLFISGSEGFQFDGVFTLSFWIKFDSHENNWPQLVSGRYDAYSTAGVQVDLSGNDRKLIVVRGNGGGGTYTQVVDKNFDQMGFVHLAFVYNGSNAKAYSDGVLKIDTTVTPVTTNILMLGNNVSCGEQSVYGKFDEVRLYKGVKSADWIAMEHAAATNDHFLACGPVTNDANAVLKNRWTTEPYATQTTWEEGTCPTLDDFKYEGMAAHGTATIAFYNKTTGEALGTNVPKKIGEYRAVITVDESRDAGATWGALDYTIDFRIVRNGGERQLGINIDRVLLMNDDYSMDGGDIAYQGYDEESSPFGNPYWKHLDADGNDAATYEPYWSVSPEFNLGGGIVHQYFYGSDKFMWELRNVRIGNTFNNGEGMPPETDEQGLNADQNYLPWNPKSQRVLYDDGYMIGPYHRYAGHIVMQNSLDARVTSSMYTNGIGTVYFDAVNGWTNNTYGADGAPNYQLVVEIATNTDYSADAPRDELVNSVVSNNLYDAEGNCTGRVAVVRSYAEYANWQQVPVRVLYFDGDDCEDLGLRDSLVLDVEKGGSYKRFYRVIAPVNIRKDVRFRIRRAAIDPSQSLSPDGHAYVLIDNVICSTPADHANLEPYGRYVESKTGKDVQGWEGAFDPAFPSAGDVVNGRAKATMENGGDVPDGTISSATMHYRWRYLNQRTTGWLLADLVPDTLVTREPLDIPDIEGDIEFWFDLNQTGGYYEYVDYSGTGLGLKDSGYSEAITSVTNRAPTHAATGDWFVRMREGKSNYAEMKLLVKESEEGVAKEYDLYVMDENLWTGFYRTEEAIAGGIWWRIEPRDRQEDGATAWQQSTNRWYVTDWATTLPSFPLAGRMVEGDTNSWSRAPCAAQTGYLQFQVDESTMGVTVIHADHQDFNHWNDAAKGYFTGSYSETNRMSGTSANVRTYKADYSTLEDTPATDDMWSLKFEGKIDDRDHPGYQTFLKKEKYFSAWDLGEGMWVYGSYREPKSPVAFQMAGSRRGYVEFADKTILEDNWPRGFESVSFNARIAQPISPKYLSYAEDSSKLTNYTFMARACFDMHRNTNFTGNAALSVYAYYRSSVGCYEARWEQVSGNIETTDPYTGLPISPVANGQRLVISRWNKVGDEYVETELAATTNSVASGWQRAMPLMPYANGDSLTNNLMPILISAYQTEKNGPTYITAAVRIAAEDKTSGVRPGVSADTEIITYQPGQVKVKDWCFVTYKDTSDARLTRGSYGVLSSNCEGLFVRPQYRAQPMWPGHVLTPQEVKTEVLNSMQGAVAATASPAFVDCRDDMEAGYWSVNHGREKPFFGGTSTDFGFSYVRPSQTIDVYTKKVGSDEDWALLKQVELTGFGHPGRQPDYQPCFYYTADSAIRLVTGDGKGGTSYDNPRVDVVISDIVQRQWRGYNNGDDETVRFNHTNFVFTTGWVTNGATQLSAKRTEVGTPCSIRSPLLDGDYGNGTGLGMFGFSYREPQKNIRLFVQIATNVSDLTSLTTGLKCLTEGDGNDNWHTVATLRYKELWEDVENANADGTKTWEISFGYHGAKGLMRVVVDPELVEELSDPDWTDTSMFGAIDITGVVCQDEPALDRHCWWGWNLQTGGDTTDSQHRMYLPDCTSDLALRGRWLALNNSVTDGTDPSESTANFKKHMPFVQSPTFTNSLIGQISFKARKYDLSDLSPDAKVVIYGTTKSPDDAPEDKDWTYITDFDITNTIFRTFSFKTDSAQFRALRLAVVNVDGTLNPPEEPKTTAAPQRVLIDEVTVSEAVRAVLAFRNVGAFRNHLGISDNSYVPGVTTKDEQPLCGENWGIQAEVFATMLGDEIDKSFVPVVRLHWYVGKDKWGYEKWKNVKADGETRGNAELKPVDDADYVYRSSYPAAPDAIMKTQNDPGTVVQYMLEVEYQTINTTKGVTTYPRATNWLDSAAWTVPDWYAPVDYNSDPSYGAGKSFAAFTILDSVAPGWAWINEANVFGTFTGESRGNTDEEFQYVEICAPMDADLSGWRVRFLEAFTKTDDVITNWVARFGSGAFDQLPGTKSGYIGVAQGKVFHLIGNKESGKLKKSDGTLDGLWDFSLDEATMKSSAVFGQLDDNAYYVKSVSMPFGIQLVRKTGVVESSIVVVGTNQWGQVAGWHEYDPTNIVAKLNKNMPGSKFFYASDDSRGTFRSASVTEGKGEDPSVWANDWACSPGRINTNFTGQVQVIDPDHPSPHGDTIIVRAKLKSAYGHIRQRIGGEGSSATNATELVILRKGDATGTNIVYTVDPWYELASVKANSVDVWAYRGHVRQYEAKGIGKGASNDVEVVATEQIDSKLSEYLKDAGEYESAIMDWLSQHRTLKWGDFANNGEIVLADYVGLNSQVVTNMTLKQMYWLDMDPTMSNQIFKAGMVKAVPYVWPVAYHEDGTPYAGDSAVTNVQMTVFMMISNKTHGAWAPYVLRGKEPGYTSLDYAAGSGGNWTSETFKVTGILANGLTSEEDTDQWVPLRWFVFGKHSFKSDFTVDIEVDDPHRCPPTEGWYNWFKDHPDTSVFNSWSIDDRLKPTAVEILQAEEQ